MILEVAVLEVIPGQEAQVEQNFQVAREIIAGMPGCRKHQLQKCLERQNRYLLLVEWGKLEDHTIGFRQSPQYGQWKALLHHFYDPFPTVEHYTLLGE